ncbi:thioredoxin family protein [Mycoplasmopsis opalescens]|uniref:thioredoxin family protein n=1 Tax=Mycoplasmopsis opalescens TaxID=114886 RepID=UPI0004A6BF11|nr:thioredoxin family protein [Mycoplasmopsis opalescens]
MFYEINTNEYNSNVRGKEELHLVVFHAIWCPPCRMFKESLQQLAANDNVPVYRVDVDQNKELANEFHVQSLPTWYVLKGKEIIHTGVGYLPYQELVQVINKLK